jgi:aerobic-type carbon monoxide dehydrogenase small subunit (CoxS/CutS family)
MPVITFNLNGNPVSVDADNDEELLWVLRDRLHVHGLKYGCGMGLCGACTSHIDGVARRTCITPVSSVAGHDVTTIDGLAKGGELHPVQKAWIDNDVAQCGYCQAGQIMQAVSLLNQNPHPTDADIDEAMGGNLCRCGTYFRIRDSIRKVAAGNYNAPYKTGQAVSGSLWGTTNG